ncbi:MAG TPA: hypothetical protein VI979_01325, partial [archaeon]|nr:hypothetical protein [archaeon]
ISSGFTKGYLLTANTTNRLLDRVESAMKAFMRKTRRISKDFDDLMTIGQARKDIPEKEPVIDVKKPVIEGEEDTEPEKDDEF